MDTTFAWTANLILIVGALCLSQRTRWPLCVTVVGESIWVVVGIVRGQADIAFICLVFALIAARNFVKWEK